MVIVQTVVNAFIDFLTALGLSGATLDLVSLGLIGIPLAVAIGYDVKINKKK